MHSIQFHLVKSGLLMITLLLVGCSQNSLVGTWRPEADDADFGLSIFSDGSGDATDRGKTGPITWRYEAGEYVLTLAGGSRELTATVREDGTLALIRPDRPGEIKVLRRSK